MPARPRTLRRLLREIAPVPAPALALAAAVALGATAGAQAPNEPARRALLMQKVKLVEHMLGSQRVQALDASGGPQVKEALDRARAQLAAGRAALDGGLLDQGEAAANDALRLVGTATTARAPQVRNEAQQRMRNQQMETELQIYRSALAESAASAPQTGTPQRAESIRNALAHVDGLMGEYGKLAGAERHIEASEPLTQAYQSVIAALNKARAGETVTIKLEFATPADELAYEQRRHREHIELLATAQHDRPAVPAVALLVERSRAQAQQVRTQAEQRAAGGDTQAAIGLMEEATDHLLRALQLLGVPVSRQPLEPRGDRP
jgi:hypothetical protein